MRLRYAGRLVRWVAGGAVGAVVVRMGGLSFDCKGEGRGIFSSFSLTLSGNSICNLLKGGNANGSALLCLVANLLHPRTKQILCGKISISVHCPLALRSVFLIPRRFTLPSIDLGRCLGLGAPFCPGFDGRLLDAYLHSFSVGRSVRLNRLSVKRGGGTFVYFTLTAGASLLMVSRPDGKLSVPSGDRFHGMVTSNVASRGSIVVSARRIESVSDLLSRIIVVSNAHMLLGTSMGAVYSGICFTRRNVGRPASATLCIRPSIRKGDIVFPGARGRRAGLGLRMLFGTVLTRERGVRAVFGGWRARAL